MHCVRCENDALLKCSLCTEDSRAYCSVECQKLDWTQHRFMHMCQSCGKKTNEIREWHGLLFRCCSDACFVQLTHQIGHHKNTEGLVRIGHDSFMGRFVLGLYRAFGLAPPKKKYTVLPTFIGANIASNVKPIGFNPNDEPASLDYNDQFVNELAHATPAERDIKAYMVQARVANSRVLQSVLDWACEEGHILTLNMLVWGAHANEIDFAYRKNYPLGAAAQAGHVGIVEFLLLRTQPDWEKIQATHRAQYQRLNRFERESEIFPLTREPPVPTQEDLNKILGAVNPGDNDNYAIRWTCEKGHTKIAKILLDDRRVDPTAKDNEPIIRAVRRGHIDIVNLLLAWNGPDRRVDPNARDGKPLKIAKKYGFIIIERSLRRAIDASAPYLLRWPLSSQSSIKK